MPEFTVIVTRAGTVKIKDAKTSEEAMEKAQALSAGDIQWDDDFIATDVSGVRLSSGEDVRTALAGCDGRIRRPAQLRRRRPHSPRRLRRTYPASGSAQAKTSTQPSPAATDSPAEAADASSKAPTGAAYAATAECSSARTASTNS